MQIYLAEDLKAHGDSLKINIVYSSIFRNAVLIVWDVWKLRMDGFI
jgi:hypothetical protein